MSRYRSRIIMSNLLAASVASLHQVMAAGLDQSLLDCVCGPSQTE